MLSGFVLCMFLFGLLSVKGDYSVTIHPEYLSQNGRVTFDAHRWDGHHDLDNQKQTVTNKAIGTRSGRWLKQDASFFEKIREDPHRKGYPDASQFQDREFQKTFSAKYLDNLKGYGYDLDTIMCLEGKTWPKWMNTSLHNGTFPNNLDAGSEIVLLTLEAISQYTDGHIPPYFEAVNEANTMWKTVNWTTIIEFYQIVTKKLRPKFPKLTNGGPAYTGGISNADSHNFRLWEKIRQFLDMAFEYLDFFSFHGFDRIYVNEGTYKFGGLNEARLSAVIDMIECYSQQKKSRHFPIIVSEFGLSEQGLEEEMPREFVEWGYVYLHISQLFTYFNFRGFIDRAGGFIVNHGIVTAARSLYYDNNTYTSVTDAYRFWQPFNHNYKFLRVDGEFNGKERLISPLTLANSHTKEVYVFLQNYQRAKTQVTLNFNQEWVHSNKAKETCFFLNSHNIPVLQKDTAIVINHNTVTVPAEAACYFAIPFEHVNYQAIPIVQEHTYYANTMVVPIHSNSVDMVLNLPELGNIKFANLRVGISTADKEHANKPNSAQFNGHPLTKSYDMYNPGHDVRDTLWGVYVYQIPVNTLKQNKNTIHLTFSRSGGFVSTVAVVVGKTSSGTGIIG